ncbi:hypothetical protein EVAR_50758_1 [Eumeta japonica]|uniref:Uncharacterized protein n=1 Tax=Eumeta variegata TaxID=151549 RepID=A0A4C1Y606_EUMVA|nr:hypothetical protein EVAR_50758_1 [Eumeta japonica]
MRAFTLRWRARAWDLFSHVGYLPALRKAAFLSLISSLTFLGSSLRLDFLGTVLELFSTTVLMWLVIKLFKHTKKVFQVSLAADLIKPTSEGTCPDVDYDKCSVRSRLAMGTPRVCSLTQHNKVLFPSELILRVAKNRVRDLSRRFANAPRISVKGDMHFKVRPAKSLKASAFISAEKSNEP